MGYFPQVLPDLPAVAYWTKGLLATLLLFASVFLHELSHALVARRYGIPVSSITLPHLWRRVSAGARTGSASCGVHGGRRRAATSSRDRRGAGGRPEGPRSIGGRPGDPRVPHRREPGRGRVQPRPAVSVGRRAPVRSLLWKLKGSFQWATRVATGVGSGFALLLMGLGVFRALGGEFVGGLWFVLIGMFLRQAAQGSYQQLVLRRALANISAGQIMTRDVVSINPEFSVAQVVDEFFWRHHVSTFPVLDGGRVVGILGLDRVKQLPRDRWAETKVRDAMLPLSDALTTTSETPLWDAFEKLTRNGVGRLAVLDRDRLVGYLSIRDVAHILAITGTRGEPASGPRGAAISSPERREAQRAS